MKNRKILAVVSAILLVATMSVAINAYSGSILEGLEINSSDTSEIIDSSTAKAYAYKHAGVNAADVKLIDCYVVKGEEAFEYAIEFTSGQYTYEYRIDAICCTIVECHIVITRFIDA